tara:strand:+ start:194744 stop:195043 length:300 start_codon:yes stop_codon:yes gene_type:complete
MRCIYIRFQEIQICDTRKSAKKLNFRFLINSILPRCTHFLDVIRDAPQALFADCFQQLKGGDPMSNGLMTPFAIASNSISTEGLKARRNRSDTSRASSV